MKKDLIDFLYDVPKLCKERQDFCEGNLNKDECFEVMKEMKSPCNDGLSVEFY